MKNRSILYLKTIFLICYLSIYTNGLIGQINVPFMLKGKVVDAKTKELIIGANIYNRHFDIGASSDKQGYFEIEIEQLPAFLEVTYVGYEHLEIRISKLTKEPITIFLNPSTGELPTAVVSATRKANEILEKKDRILDFEFFGENILLLIRDEKMGKERLELRDGNDEVVDSYILEKMGNKKTFHKTCLGSVDIINGKKVYPVVMEEDIILGLGEAVGFHKYDWEVMKCKLANDENVYYQIYSYYGQRIRYHLFGKDRNTNYVFTEIYDEEKIRLLYEDMLPLLLADKYGNDMTVDTPERMEQIRNDQEELDGKMQFFYQPIYAPLFQQQNELVLFDCFNGEIKFYNKNGNPLRSIEIAFYKKEGWNKEIIQDAETEKFYSLFSTKTGKAVCEINIRTGKLKELVYFNSNSLNKLELKNGQLYFLENNLDPVFNHSVNVLKKVKVD